MLYIGGFDITIELRRTVSIENKNGCLTEYVRPAEETHGGLMLGTLALIMSSFHISKSPTVGETGGDGWDMKTTPKDRRTVP